MTTLAIDIGGTKLAAALVTDDLLLCDRRELPTPASKTADALNTALEALVRPLCMRAKRVAIASTGIIREGNLIAINPQNLGGLMHFPLVKTLREITGLPTLAINDAQAAAWAEYQAMADKVSDMAFITVSTGVGGGVILDQKIIAGKHGLGGEIGHIHVRDDEWEHCNCGGVGCLEQVSSATGIAREARRTMAKSDKPSALREFGDNVSAKDVMDAAKAGDEMALEVMKTVSHYLGLALAQVALTVDPEIFVIGGGVSKAGQFLIDMIQKDYDHFTPISENKAKLGLATLGNDAGIYGAARLVL